MIQLLPNHLTRPHIIHLGGIIFVLNAQLHGCGIQLNIPLIPQYSTPTKYHNLPLHRSEFLKIANDVHVQLGFCIVGQLCQHLNFIIL
jgi:hypothetical protein